MKSVFLRITVIFFVILIPAGISSAQDEAAQSRMGEEERQLKYEDVITLRKTEKEPLAKKNFVFAYGGWVTFANTHYNDLDNNKSVEDWVKEDFYVDTRVWVRAMWYQLLSFYGRLQDYYVWRPRVASDYNGIGDDNKGPLIDMLYGELDLMRQYNVPFKVRVGRQFLTLGRGITYANVHDGVEFEYQVGRYIHIKGFMSQTKEFEDNIDYSVPGYDKKGNNRQFYGVETAVVDGKTSIYSYVLVQRDHSRAYPETPGQNYTYNSEYIGGGVKGEAFPSLEYWGEYIKEYGDCNTDTTRASLAVKDVDAWAFNLGTKYEMNFYSHPVLEGEASYGSGNKSRERVTNTVGGDADGKDKNFLYFGIFEAGYALYPRLSNMYIYKVGLSLTPFEFLPYWGDKIAIGTRYYIYRKDQPSGGIYDIEATATSEDVGQEADFFGHWKIYENLYFTMRYGLFTPGAAYPATTRTPSQYLYMRIRFTF